MPHITVENNSYIVTKRELERGELSLNFTFDEALLESYLPTYDLVSFDQLSAQLTLKEWRDKGIFVEGNLTAACAQKCVVSLQPVSQSISTDISQTFLPAKKTEPGLEIEIDIDEDMPDDLVNNELDLVPFILEHFALELDLYPRSENAEIEPQYQPPTDDELASDKPSPFAVLKDLKKPN